MYYFVISNPMNVIYSLPTGKHTQTDVSNQTHDGIIWNSMKCNMDMSDRSYETGSLQFATWMND